MSVFLKARLKQSEIWYDAWCSHCQRSTMHRETSWVSGHWLLRQTQCQLCHTGRTEKEIL